MRACELRISDCDSDVCSSDLGVVRSGSIQKPAGSWLIDGIGEDFVPPNCELDRVREAFEIPDRESFDAARLLLRREGILGGSSTGTLLAAALRYCRAQPAPKRVVTLVCDSGNKYLSKMYNATRSEERRVG